MDELVIAGKKFKSRLITGTGKHRSSEDLHNSIIASETEMITVAIRRINFDDPKEKNLLDVIDWDKYNILPNTAGSKTAEEAIYTAMLAREVTQSNWIKVEVIPDAKFLLPDPIGTLEACEKLVKEGFIVLPYISPDPVLAKRLEDVGCSTVMPLGSPIGSGRGVLALEEIQIIIEQSGIPVVVDAGLGVPSEASLVMESGADAVLVNTAIAGANDPKTMGEAFKLGVRAGRKAFLSGRIPITKEANPSSPKDNIVNT